MRPTYRLLISALLSLAMPAAGAPASEQAIIHRRALEMLDARLAEDLAGLSRELIDRYPESDEGREALYLLARAKELQGHFPEALAAYGQFLKLSPHNIHRLEARLKIGLLRAGSQGENSILQGMLEAIDLRATNRYDRAIAQLTALAEAHPADPLADDALHLAASIQLLDHDDSVAAEGLYRRLIRDYPESTLLENAYYGLGMALEKQDRRQEAREIYTEIKQRHIAVSLFGAEVVKDNFYSRLWFNKVQARLGFLDEREQIYREGKRILARQGFMLGIGDRLFIDQPVGSGQGVRSMTQLSRELGLHAQFIAHWITRDTNWRWETPDRLRALYRSGHTPVVIDWYFGDEISPEQVENGRKAYLDHIRDQLIPLIADLPEVYVLLEPEFNKNGVEQWPGWGELAIEVIELIKHRAPGARVGLTLGNWVEAAHSELPKVIGKAVARSDFIGFQEMVSVYDASSALDPAWDPVDRSLHLVRYLHETFGKPIFFGYLAVSTYGDWEQQQARLLRRFGEALPAFAYFGVFGASYFALFDDPLHQGWFAAAEKNFGLVDSQGRKKAALAAWRTWGDSLNEIGSEPPQLLAGAEPSWQALDFSMKPLVESRFQLSKWCDWRVVIRGKKSGARTVFQGAGSQVLLRWNGLADQGRYDREPCEVRLTARDPTGNRIETPIIKACRILKPHPHELFHTQSATGNRRLYHWGGGSYQFQPGGGALGGYFSLDLSRPPAGIVVPLREGQGLDLTGLRQEGSLRLRLRLPDGDAGAEGVILGLEDGKGVHTTVLAAAYIDPAAAGGWQGIRIPLAHFDANGVKETGGVKPAKQPLDWGHIDKLLLTTTLRPAHMEIAEIEIIR
ncbi:MAG: tetratricopeptide repeat protein [Gammaproteobacteria bacterium]|nr:tetratricopeptide repeat protein [Gammaproteobacteria bacterium]MBU1653987.1 tetratricopeptide repeat protein [Gammaproteobacteria bacterium]MBU1960461.1 tetratricopeptide repeat protein [Gammaproteobacteria bacterium]